MSVYTEDFEQRFESQFPLELQQKSILLAVSGGADSMAMLSCSLNLLENPKYNSKYSNLKIKVVTINHRLREEEESMGDCLFVKNFCDLHQISCFIKNAEPYQIENLEKQRDNGIEEAARFFRYEIFNDVALKENCKMIFLAHNKDDQLETLIQRFFQGASGSSILGIPQKRDNFFRPMINFSKNEIYRYLKEKNIKYRTDKTNFENTYLRNKIRNTIIPCIQENFIGWESALLKGVQKRTLDEDFFLQECEKYPWLISENQASMDRKLFESLHISIKIRLVYQALNRIKSQHRIPFEIIENFCNGKKTNSGGVNFLYIKDKVLINNIKNSSTESYFFAIIEESEGLPKILQTPKGLLKIYNKNDIDKQTVSSCKKISIPCFVELKNDNFEFSDIPSEKKEIVFVKIEEEF